MTSRSTSVTMLLMRLLHLVVVRGYKASLPVRAICYSLIMVMIVISNFSVLRLLDERNIRAENNSIAAREETLRNFVLTDLKVLVGKITEAQNLGADVAAAQTELIAIKQLIFVEKKFVSAGQRIKEQLKSISELINQQTLINAAKEAEKQKGIVSGTVKEGSTPLTGVKIALRVSGTEVTSATSGSDGKFSISYAAGTYQLVASKTGYSTYTKSGIVVTALQALTHDVSLSKAISNPPPPPSNNSLTNGESSYELATVNGYSIHLAKFNLASGQFRVITDTANDDDCTDNCPAKSVSSYVSGHGGFAGMNGTYFCPPDYSSCAGQTNSFFWKVYNSRLNKMINANNGLGENEPFIAFNSAGTARYFNSWISYGTSGFAASAGINCGPPLISGGNNVLSPASLDEKQRTVKSNRGAVGLKGQTLYFVIAKSATVVDLAGIMDSLEVDYALNLDGGGSSAMMFNNSYKVGPGRALPNAIVVARR